MYQILSGNLVIARGKSMAACIEQLAHCACPTIIEIEQCGDTQIVTICKDIWVNKRNKLPRSYTMGFSRYDILNDIFNHVIAMNGYEIQKL
jgi:hypothetical protein